MTKTRRIIDTYVKRNPPAPDDTTRPSFLKTPSIESIITTVGPQLRRLFPTPEDLETYLIQNREILFKRIYGSEDKNG